MAKDSYDKVKNSSIWPAIMNGNTAEFHQLLDANPALANEPDKYGRVPLFYLAALNVKGHSGRGMPEDTRTKMIDRLFEIPGINLRAKAGPPATNVSVMDMALSVGDHYLFEKLLDADPALANEPDQYGRVPLLYLTALKDHSGQSMTEDTRTKMIYCLECL